jgi:hypothetical protein
VKDDTKPVMGGISYAPDYKSKPMTQSPLPLKELLRIQESLKAEGAAEEREACARLFEAELEEGLADMTFREWCEWMAARIRARGAPP